MVAHDRNSFGAPHFIRQQPVVGNRTSYGVVLLRPNLWVGRFSEIRAAKAVHTMLITQSASICTKLLIVV
ncbi:hypothetical protein WS87_13730 [Burkholderia sp. MSMB0856]|nr:hypothetical protein WS87_13730 [Burkholderia sp. MSMB0856]KVH30125.1 hypothetical protein WS87_26745 [Burkholderia sp. MSMB0856]